MTQKRNVDALSQIPNQYYGPHQSSQYPSYYVGAHDGHEALLWFLWVVIYSGRDTSTLCLENTI